ncbi:MAG: BatD family protein [Candidatus Neomarinimicrobiota bacterium]|nr:BatD family protein [Candidatus Neomarinimicrobiota bacterium]
MKKLLSFLLFFSFLLCQNIETIVSNKNVSLNESLDFIIKLEDIDTNPEVNFVPMLDYFSIISGPNIGSEYKFINGKKSSSRSISWRIIPKKTGEIKIPNLEVKVGRKIYLTEDITINVSEEISNTSSNDMFLKVELSNSNVKIGEQITIRYIFFTRIASRVIETEFPEFEGFWVEKLYDPSGTQIDPDSWNDVVIDNYKYKSLKLYEVALFPLSDGVFDLEPMIMKVETKEKDPSFKRLFWDDPFFDTFSQKTKARILVSDKQTIKVENLKNQPDNFTGAVGVFEVNSSLSSLDVENGTPVTFYLELVGEGNLDNIGRPEIDFPDNFDIFEGEIKKDRNISDRVSGSIIWEYNLIPRKSGNYTIKSVEFPFFDTGINSWNAIKTNPIRFSVIKTLDMDYSETNGNFSSSREIRYIKLNMPNWKKENSDKFYIGYVSILLLSLVLFLSPFFSSKFSSFINIQSVKFKNRSALSNATNILSSSKDIYSDCSHVINQFFFDKALIDSINVDYLALKKQLENKIKSKDLVVLKEILDQCNKYNYTELSSKKDNNIKNKTIKLLSRINQYV